MILANPLMERSWVDATRLALGDPQGMSSALDLQDLSARIATLAWRTDCPAASSIRDVKGQSRYRRHLIAATVTVNIKPSSSPGHRDTERRCMTTTAFGGSNSCSMAYLPVGADRNVIHFGCRWRKPTDPPWRRLRTRIRSRFASSGRISRKSAGRVIPGSAATLVLLRTSSSRARYRQEFADVGTQRVGATVRRTGSAS